jgi:ELWxxDGT repeat protein
MTRPRWFVCPLLAALAAILGPVASAQTARQVRDINLDGPVEPQTRRNADQLHFVGGRAVYFSGLPKDFSEPARDVRLWATDGSSVEELTSFCHLRCSTAPLYMGSTPVVLFFALAEFLGDDVEGSLWRTDGTRAGTFPVWTTRGFGLNYATATLKGQLAFSGCDLSGLCGLWLTDGTRAGTRRVSRAVPFDMAVAGGRLYFLGTDGRYGLFVSDGTAAGTRLVRRVSDELGYLWLLTTAGSRLYFMTGELSGELWTSDGTTAGTRFLRAFPESGHDWLPRNTNFLLPRGERIYFLAEGGLWTADGGAPAGRGIRLLSRNFVKSQAPGDFAFLPDGRLLYSEGDGVTGDRLWTTRDGTESTAIVSGCPGGCPTVDSPHLLPLGDGRVLFSGNDLAHGTELWITDGTGAGTRLVSDLCPGPCDTSPQAVRRVGGRLFFAGRSAASGTGYGLHSLRLAALEPGAPGGPLLLAALDQDTAAELEVVGEPGRYFFAGFDAVQGRQLWTTDGTRQGTRIAAVFEAPAPSSAPEGLVELGERLLFFADDGRERGLWRAGASGLDAEPVLPAGSLGRGRASHMAAVAGELAYFFHVAAEGAQSGPGAEAAELWRSDGTAAGTVRLATFPDRALSLALVLGGRFYFLVSSFLGEPPLHSLWESDGTPAGTLRRLDLPDDALRVVRAQAVGSEIYLVVRRESGHQLFRSDGTPEGTRALYTFECENCLDEAEDIHLVRAYGSLYFTTRVAKPAGAFYSTLVRTDGTAAGTVEAVPDRARPLDDQPQPLGPPFLLGSELFYLAYAPGLRPGSSFPFALYRGAEPAVSVRALAYYGEGDIQPTLVGTQVFFRGGDRRHGTELWATDGTAAGTRRVRDLLPGPLSGDPQNLFAARERLYFTAFDPEHGRELWRSDGTEAGTVRVQDLAPGAASSDPSGLTEAGGRLFFSADDGLTGRELWSLPTVPEAAPAPSRRPE